jgi:uncharacterized membrane protein
MMDGGYAGPADLMMVIMPLLTILLVVGLVLAINALYPSRGQGERRPTTEGRPPGTAAEAELELRYARGEIDAEGLARQRAVLRRG